MHLKQRQRKTSRTRRPDRSRLVPRRSRTSALTFGKAQTTGLLLLTSLALTATTALANDVRALSFYHTHTGETLTVEYWRDGVYRETALAEINHFLRDFRTGDAAAMDPALLDLLHEVFLRTGSEGHFEVISAYRSPKTNEMLRGRSSGVAKNSQHLNGKAIDVRLTDVPTKRLRAVAYELGLGGVGFYEVSDFVHLDTGRFRTW
ncbi:MAG: DUF882 domain-containing protein [Pseudomonadota bacterium]